VFFELLTARLPFGGDMKELFRQHRTVDLPKPSMVITDGEPLDVRVDEIIARATAKDPAKRHPDVGTFMYELRTLMQMLGVDTARARRRVQNDTAPARRELDHRVKAAAEIFNAVNMPMAACDVNGKVRAANPAFLAFVGAAGDAGGLELRDSALPDVYPTLFEDLEAAVVLNAAPSSAEVTAGEVFIVIHPLRSLLT
jgi:PAS domain-containing protein